MDRVFVGDLALPCLLTELLDSGAWKLPPDSIIEDLMPFLIGPIDLLLDVESIRENSPAGEIPNYDTDDADLLELLLIEECEYELKRISYRREERNNLPWLDGNLAVCLGENREHGDDTMLALDYRGNIECPRVVANEWTTSECIWREVFKTFEQMATSFGMIGERE